jgi:SOS-response transcriptional repressor LexA
MRMRILLAIFYTPSYSFHMKKPPLLVKSNLEWLLKSRNINPYELARQTGVPQPTIHRILTGESADPRTSTLQGLAAYFNVHVSNLRDVDLATGEKFGPDSSPAFDQNVKPARAGGRAIPVISAVQAGLMTDMEAPYAPGDGFDIIYTDDELLSAFAFGLEIEGLSMMPDFRPGDRVIIDPDLAPNPGDFVVAKNGGNQATFKKYRPRGVSENGDEIFELVPLNEDFASMRSDATHLQVIGVMTEHRKRFRRGG